MGYIENEFGGYANGLERVENACGKVLNSRRCFMYISALSDVPPSELPPPPHIQHRDSFTISLSVPGEIRHGRRCIIIVRSTGWPKYTSDLSSPRSNSEIVRRRVRITSE